MVCLSPEWRWHCKCIKKKSKWKNTNLKKVFNWTSPHLFLQWPEIAWKHRKYCVGTTAVQDLSVERGWPGGSLATHLGASQGSCSGKRTCRSSSTFIWQCFFLLILEKKILLPIAVRPKAWIMVEVNALAQGALRQFTQWPWIEHPTFQLRGGHFTTELLPPQQLATLCLHQLRKQTRWSVIFSIELFWWASDLF